MSTHILSDIEALCDQVAILRQGKLAATGKLDELLTQSGETQQFEIVLKGICAEHLNGIGGAKISPKPNGVSVQVLSETDVEKVFAAAKAAGGKLISVQPIKQSLEELFVKETA
jgi:ABC-2 type transport system ATP-binding protein